MRFSRALYIFLLLFSAAAVSVQGSIVSDGGFEGYWRYKEMYSHVNASIEYVMSAGWDLGTTDIRFPVSWGVRNAPAGYLRASEDARSGKYALEFGKGGTVYNGSYITPAETVGRYPVKEGRSLVTRVWAKGTGQLTACVREYPSKGGPRDVPVGAPETLSPEWKEYFFVYTPDAGRMPENVELGFMADGLAKLDDLTTIDVVEFGRLLAGLDADLKTAQADAAAGLLPEARVTALAPEIGAFLQKAREPAPAVLEQLALREEIAPAAQRLAALVWEGKGKRAGRIGLSSERFRVEFYGKDLNFRIASISDPARGVEFLGPYGSEVWQLRLVNPDWKPEWDPAAQVPPRLFLTSDSMCASRRSTMSRDGRKLTLDWIGVRVPGTKETLNVRVTVRLPQGERLARWHIKVSGGIKDCAINEVHFPRLASLTPMTPDGADDYLVIPQVSGRLIKNPYSRSDLSPWMNLQMWALYSDRAGLYCATEDGDAHEKNFSFQSVSNEKQLTAQVINYPENNMTGGNIYDMPFETVLGTFDGTWWAASKIYRKWAVQQKWCTAFGPLHSSKDTPRWYKDLPIFMLMYEIGGTEEDVLSGKVTGAMQGNYRRMYPGLPFAYCHYGWENGHLGYAQGEYSPPGFGLKGWPVFIKQLHENGARVVPYVQGAYYNTKFDWFTKQGGKEGQIHFGGGGTIVYDEKAGSGYANMTPMCPASARFQDLHVEVAKMLATCGADGIYYDSFPGWEKCYNPAHGHPLGGGKWLTDGNRRLIARVREAVKPINPEMIFVSETTDETTVGALDGSLQFRYASPPDHIPLFSSIYHDYILLYGCTFEPKYETYPPWASIPLAYQFVRGDQLGWTASGWHFEPQYTTYLANLRTGQGRKFLTCGEMVEPPAFLNAVPTVTTPPWNPGAEKERVFPAVLHSAWKAPDGTFGLVFANIADKDQEVEYEIDAAARGLPVGKGYGYAVRDMVSRIVLDTYETPVFRRKDKVVTRQALILEISAVTAGK